MGGLPFVYDIAIGSSFSAYPDDVKATASDQSDSVIGKIAGFRGQAESLNQQAMGLLASAAGFSVRGVGDVSFGPTVESFNSLSEVSGLPVPSVFAFSSNPMGSIGDPSKLKIEPFDPSTFRAPKSDGAEFDSPPDPPSVGSAPQEPAAANLDVTVPRAPNVTISPPSLLHVGGPPPVPGSIENPPNFDLIDVLPIDIESIQLPDEGALDRMRSAIDRKFQRNPYRERMMPQVMQAVGSLLSGNMVIDLEELDAGVIANLTTAMSRHNHVVGTLWSRRRFVDHGFANSYNERVRERILEEHRADFDAAVERWRMKLVPVILRLATEAHAFMVEMEGELYDYDFELLAIEHQAMQSLYALVVAQFNLGLARMNMAAVQYRGLIEYVKSKAERYRSVTQIAQAKGQTNNAIADGYSAELRALGAEADSFGAMVDSAEAQLQAFDAQMRGREMKARTLRADLIKFQAEVAEWQADVSKVEADYRVARGKNRAVVAQNRARAAEMTAEAAEQTGAAQEARASAMEAIVKSASLQAEAATRSGNYAQIQYGNMADVMQYQSDVIQYRIDAEKYGADASNDIQLWDNTSRINASVAATYSEIGRSAIRAAQLTQQGRIALSDAYQGLYDSIGRADAARIAGELSRYRASLALRASGDVDYSSQVSTDAQYRHDVTKEGSNARRTEWTAAEQA